MTCSPRRRAAALSRCQTNCAAPVSRPANYPADPATKTIVDDAVAEPRCWVRGRWVRSRGPFNRAKLANGTTENRGGESTLGNLVAEVQRWATRAPTAGSRADRVHEPRRPAHRHGRRRAPAPFPRTLTYKQAAEVQPFANGLVNMDLTGAQIKAALEQQWQPTPAVVASVPEARHRPRASPTPTTRTRPEGSRITGMWLNGEPIAPAHDLLGRR